MQRCGRVVIRTEHLTNVRIDAMRIGKRKNAIFGVIPGVCVFFGHCQANGVDLKEKRGVVESTHC